MRIYCVWECFQHLQLLFITSRKVWQRFFAALEDPALGISIAVAIAIHNIPEGVAVSIPIYFATGSKKKAFKYSFSSGLSEPVGAIVGYFILMNLQVILCLALFLQRLQELWSIYP